MTSITIKAPAKLNIFLQVLRKRPDKYHDIYSLFHKIKLSDELVFKKTKENKCRIVCASRKFPKGKENLIAKAYHLLKKEAPFEGGVEVRVKKRIPMAGGMGGGSSDAAAALIALNKLFRLQLKPGKMKRLAVSLGADVPFFLEKSQSALVSGIGEKIRPLSYKPKFYFLIIMFPKGLSTPKVYRGLNLTPQRGGVTIFPFAVKDFRLDKQLRNCLRNDLMRVAFKYYPIAEKVYKKILETGFSASQTGSGPTLFVPHSRKKPLSKLGKVLENIFNVKTLVTQSL